ncbi:MAG: hypothetical protein GY803_28575 [Chloroflexi bacterium]|nr:hypothetical protein [Chloroflexota bacterium]
MQRIGNLWLIVVSLWILTACGESVAETAVSTSLPNTPIPTEGTVVETAVETVVEAAVEAAKRPPGQEVNGYANASYTEANADLIGKTNRLQLLSVYATW